MEEVKTFYRIASDYCSFIENEIDLDSIPLLIELLMTLYISAMKLPDVNPKSGYSFQSAESTTSRIKLSNQIEDSYWMVYNPFVKEEPVCGRLTDDLGDIYSDLKSGLMEYCEGRIDNAIWEWKSGLNSHWGNHVTDALKALNALRCM